MNTSISEKEMRDILSNSIKDRYGHMREFCRCHKMNSGNVSRMLTGHRTVSKEVAQLFGYNPVRRYEKIED